MKKNSVFKTFGQRRFLFLLTLIVGISGHCWAQTPSLITYQGRIVTGEGVQISDGTHDLLFELYDAPLDGNLIWAGSYDVPILEGRFSVVLGAAGKQLPAGLLPKVNDLSFAFDGGRGDRYLQITVDSGAPMLPRQLMGAVPYAVTASNGVPPGTVLPFFGPVAPEGWLLCDGQEYSRAGRYNRLFTAIGTSCGAPSNESFRVPDLRGRFLRGLDNMGSPTGPANRDAGPRSRMNDGGEPTGLGSVQVWSTARPHIPFVTSPEGNHDHRLKVFRTSKHAHATNGSSFFDAIRPTHHDGTTDAPIEGTPNHTHTIISGGDAETRPLNAVCNFIIKY